jgi:alkanesulfonate monooxygenase SsuD/methylene tetrahydromethanopterin reductase-like flavin-dependent oxidoreductase (luciferase family)
MSKPRFGVVVHPEPDVQRDLARSDLDSLWVGGHIAAPFATPEAVTGLAALAAHSARQTIGTSVVELPLYEPTVLAKQIAEIDRVSHGRVVLGVGVGGEFPEEFEACGVPLAGRGARADAAIARLRELWTGSSQGRAGTVLRPPPHQHGGPPVLVAGRKPPAMRRAAALGDGWMPYLYSPGRYRSSRAAIIDEAARLGRPLVDFQWTLFVFTSIDSSQERARQTAREHMGGNYDQDFSAFLDSVAVAGTPGYVAERFGQFTEAGVEHFVIAPCGRDPRRVVEQLYGQVLPEAVG